MKSKYFIKVDGVKQDAFSLNSASFVVETNSVKEAVAKVSAHLPIEVKQKISISIEPVDVLLGIKQCTCPPNGKKEKTQD